MADNDKPTHKLATHPQSSRLKKTQPFFFTHYCKVRHVRVVLQNSCDPKPNNTQCHVPWIYLMAHLNHYCHLGGMGDINYGLTNHALRIAFLLHSKPYGLCIHTCTYTDIN